MILGKKTKTGRGGINFAIDMQEALNLSWGGLSFYSMLTAWGCRITCVRAGDISGKIVTNEPYRHRFCN